jgi:hypothetical protein
MDRYEIIKTVTPNNQNLNSPVKVEVFNILFDNQEQKKLVQPKFTVLCEKPVKSVYIDVICYDSEMNYLTTIDNVLCSNTEAKGKGESFGSRQTIAIDDEFVANVSIVIKKAIFADGTGITYDEKFRSEFKQKNL